MGATGREAGSEGRVGKEAQEKHWSQSEERAWIPAESFPLEL